MLFFNKDQFLIKKQYENQKSGQKEKKDYEITIKPYNFYTKNEIEISQIIIRIPNYSRFFHPIIRNSFVNIAEIDDKCIENFTESQNSDKNKYMLIKKKSIETQNFTTFFDYFYSTFRENQENPRKYLFNLINSYKYSLEMIKQLENVKLINLCFHPSRLIFKEELPVLSNFERFFYY